MIEWIVVHILYPIIRSFPVTFFVLVARLLGAMGALFSPLAWKLRTNGPIKISPFRFVAIGYWWTVARFENLLWKPKMDRLQDVSSMVQLVYPHYLEEAMNSNRGIILVTIHSFHFRLLQHWINQNQYGLKPYLVKDFPEDATTAHSWYEEAHRQQVEIFEGRLLNVRSNLKQAIQILRAGGIIMLVQDLITETAPPVQFLGKTVRNPLGAVRMAEMTDAVIVPLVISSAKGPKWWQLRFYPPIDARSGEIKKHLIQALENMIATYPEMWRCWGTLW